MYVIGIDTRLTITGEQYPWRLVLYDGQEKTSHKIALPEGKVWINTPFDKLYGDLLKGSTLERTAQYLLGKVDRVPVAVMSRHANLKVFRGLHICPVKAVVDEDGEPYEADAEINTIMRHDVVRKALKS